MRTEARRTLRWMAPLFLVTLGHVVIEMIWPLRLANSIEELLKGG